MTIPELQEKIIRQEGFTSWYGSPKSFADLNPDQKVRVNFLMQRYVADNPSQFEAAQVAVAQRFAATNTGAPLADTSLGASISEFGSAFADEVVKKTDIGFNFGGKLVTLVVIIAAVWFFFFRLKK